VSEKIMNDEMGVGEMKEKYMILKFFCSLYSGMCALDGE
jgi:hypothetical protein